MSGTLQTVQEPLVSIIIPVYNAERYLDETLRSVSEQVYRMLEIICVNDGSTDGSADILNKWIEKDSRIRVITQDNHGAGVARNRGMDAASGKYIIFLDADDLFQKKMLRVLVETAEKKDTDIILFGYYRFDGKKKVKAEFAAKEQKVPINKVLSPDDIYDRLFQVDHGMPWNKFYKRDFIRRSKVLFQPLQNTNDEFFSRIISAEANRILYLNKAFVTYRVGNKSSLQGKMDQNILDFIQALKAIHDELKKRGFYERYYSTFQEWACNLIMWRLAEKKDSDSFEILANEICLNTLKQCEINADFVEEKYKNAYRALENNNISGVSYELRHITKESLPVSQKIKRRWKRYFGKPYLTQRA